MASFKHTFTSGQTVTPARLNDARDVFDIVNADIKSNAAIAHSKLANITSGQVLLGNASNVPTATAVTGDVTISNTGVTAIGSGVIVNADVNNNAAIALSKLATGALPTAITVASANLVDGTIVNADINNSAAIAGTKIAPDFGSQTITTSGSANIGRPSDHWGANGVFVVGGATKLGQLDTHGAFEVTLTSNGYRDNTAGTNLWKSYGANGVTGAAQISLNPNGVILFNTEGVKATGSSAGVTERMRITAAGNVGIGTSSPGWKLDVDGAVNTNAVYRVNGVSVVGPRRTGWTAPTGTLSRGTFDSSTVTLPQLAARVHALIDDLAAHGLIDS